METSQSIASIAKALAAFQGEMGSVLKSNANPFFKSKYAGLDVILNSVREYLKKHEICIVQNVTTSDSGVCVSTRLIHSSGEWFHFGPLTIPLLKKDPQTIGSAITYGKRYALSACLAISCDEDDDGEKAMARNHQEKPKGVDKKDWDELQSLINQCDSEYQKNIWDYMNGQGIQSLEDLDQKTFHKLKKGCNSNLAARNSHANNTH